MTRPAAKSKFVLPGGYDDGGTAARRTADLRRCIKVVQRGRGLGFAAKSLEHSMIVGNILGQEFERDEAVETRVLGLVDDAHSAAAQLLQDAIMRDGAADHE